MQGYESGAVASMPVIGPTRILQGVSIRFEAAVTR